MVRWSNGELRIGDAERETAIASLGEHFALGRLTRDEYDERAALAFGARTNREITSLFRDLPTLPPKTYASLPQSGNQRRDVLKQLPIWPFVAVVAVAMIAFGAPWWGWLVLGWLWLAGGLVRLVRSLQARAQATLQHRFNGATFYSNGNWRAERGRWE
ncbi:MAG: DUF1707 domain-containing protein [Nocardioidaceae bacterium]|nr:MAG: DUF1707 domain-containing protein [Nocardioidaceae bacterium]